MNLDKIFVADELASVHVNSMWLDDYHDTLSNEYDFGNRDDADVCVLVHDILHPDRFGLAFKKYIGDSNDQYYKIFRSLKNGHRFFHVEEIAPYKNKDIKMWKVINVLNPEEPGENDPEAIKKIISMVVNEKPELFI